MGSIVLLSQLGIYILVTPASIARCIISSLSPANFSSYRWVCVSMYIVILMFGQAFYLPVLLPAVVQHFRQCIFHAWPCLLAVMKYDDGAWLYIIQHVLYTLLWRQGHIIVTTQYIPHINAPCCIGLI